MGPSQAPNVFAPPRPTAPAPAAPGPVTEDEAPWEHLSPDTDDLTARADTAPRPAVKSGSSRKYPVIKGPAPRNWAAHRTSILIALAIGACILVGVVVAVVLALLGPSKSKETGDNRPPPGNVLVVSHDGAVRSVFEALKKAQPGDRIRVRDAVQECVVLKERRFQNLTIESEDANKPVTWTFPADPRGMPQLIDVQNVEGLTIQHLVLDGGDRANEVVRLHGNCPGLKLDDLKIKGFKQSGVLITNCGGTPEKPVSLLHLRFFADNKQRDAGIAFKHVDGWANPPQNQHIIVQSCYFEGQFKDRYWVPDKAANDDSVKIDQ
jgi:hypothetical protein